MRPGVRSTVDRLDAPSAYYHSRNNKRKRNDHGRDGRDGKDGDTDMADAKPEEPPEDPLRNATTLYVDHFTQQKSRYMSSSPNAARSSAWSWDSTDSRRRHVASAS
ncbi:hypothetical protein O1611_g8292 [Lasiodiplodia mahajangana]|uniref:Uncharacterized protein n=1 Tax=Lasiodiplodia mahajangana TaxID=1108764 RepID=A0ACC2JCV0_9PEZI|nr:hypothetical protein O1611_g8292 [Lasiodiplodia mahajangana]